MRACSNYRRPAIADPQAMPQPVPQTDSGFAEREILAEHARQTARSCAWLSGVNRLAASGKFTARICGA